VQLEKEVTKEKNTQQRELNQILRTGQELELETLKTEQARAKTTFGQFQIKEKELQVFGARLQAIREQGQAEIDESDGSASERERIQNLTEQRITQFKQQEVLRRIQAEQTTTQSVSDEAKKQEAIRNALDNARANRLGGANSPLQSVEEISLESASLSSFRETALTRRGLGRAPSLLNVQQQVDEDIRRSQRAANAPASTSTSQSNNTTINLNGMKLTDPDIQSDGDQFADKMMKKVRQRRLLNGPGAPSGIK